MSDIFCKTCNKEFLPNNHREIYCSEVCRNISKRKYSKSWQKKRRVVKFKNCKVCNKEFEIIGNNNTFCSNSCKELSFSDKWKPKVKKRIHKCSICTKEFETNNKTSKFCSEDCRREGKKLYKKSKRKKINKKNINREDGKKVYKTPMYQNIKYSANEDKAINALVGSGFNIPSIAEVLGRTTTSVINRKMEVNIQNFNSPVNNNIDKSLHLKEIIAKLGKSQKPKEAISNHIIYNNLIREGFEIFRVTREGAEFDLVALKNNKFFKIQSKTAGFRESINTFRVGANIFFKAKLTKKGPVYGEYKYHNIDFFIFNCLGINTSYVIPSLKIKNIPKTAQLAFYPHRNQHKQQNKFLDTEVYKERYDLIK